MYYFKSQYIFLYFLLISSFFLYIFFSIYFTIQVIPKYFVVFLDLEKVDSRHRDFLKS